MTDFKPGDRVIVTIDGHDTEWTVVEVFSGMAAANAIVRRLSEDRPIWERWDLQLPFAALRPVPMEEPTEWGAKVTDDLGDHWLFSYESGSYGQIWIRVDGESCGWSEIRNPRPYTGGDDD